MEVHAHVDLAGCGAPYVELATCSGERHGDRSSTDNFVTNP